MIAARIACIITLLAAAMWSATGLLDSLTQFGVGLAIAGGALCGYGLCDHIESRRDEQLARTRDAVWARRDQHQDSAW